MVVIVVLAILVVALLVWAFIYDRRAGRSGEPLTDHETQTKAQAAARRAQESLDLYGGMTPSL
jgi:hypothetical protein